MYVEVRGQRWSRFPPTGLCGKHLYPPSHTAPTMADYYGNFVCIYNGMTCLLSAMLLQVSTGYISRNGKRAATEMLKIMLHIIVSSKQCLECPFYNSMNLSDVSFFWNGPEQELLCWTSWSYCQNSIRREMSNRHGPQDRTVHLIKFTHTHQFLTLHLQRCPHCLSTQSWQQDSSLCLPPTALGDFQGRTSKLFLQDFMNILAAAWRRQKQQEWAPLGQIHTPGKEGQHNDLPSHQALWVSRPNRVIISYHLS